MKTFNSSDISKRHALLVSINLDFIPVLLQTCLQVFADAVVYLYLHEYLHYFTLRWGRALG